MSAQSGDAGSVAHVADAASVGVLSRGTRSANAPAKQHGALIDASISTITVTNGVLTTTPV